MSEVTATDEKLKPLDRGNGRRHVLDTRRRARSPALDPSAVDVPRVSMLANARVLAGSGWLGLKDREAYRDARRQADADVHGRSGAGGAAGFPHAGLVARGPLTPAPLKPHWLD